MNDYRGSDDARCPVALFGGGGFIGVHLAHLLDETGDFAPHCYDLSDAKLRLRYQNRPYRYTHCDIATDRDAVDRAVRDSDIVVNLAAYVRPKVFIDTPLEVVELNLFQCLHVVEACVRHDKRLLHFSTSEVYGKTGGSDQPFREDHTDCILGPIANHRWIYSNAKQLLDRIIHAHGLAGNLRYTIVRPFNFVGPLMDWLGHSDEGPPRVFANFMTALLLNEPLRLVNGGHSRRCFTAIDDAVQALYTLMAHPEATHNQIVNIGNPANETTIAELALLMKQIYRRETGSRGDPPVVSVSGDTFYGPGYEDCDRRLPDISKLTALGWRPSQDLDATFTTAVRFCLQHREALLNGRVPR